MNRPKVSVVIPVYGVEKYIARCVKSLMEQSLDDIEYIFVDDCTPDKSIEILRGIIKNYPSREKFIKIIRHEKNVGHAAARTTGMNAMTGEYMIHCDPDDWLELDAYEIMYNTAIRKNADIVTCGHLNESPETSVLFNTAFTGEAIETLKTGNMSFALWDKMIKTSIILDNEIFPFPGINFSEDLNVCIRAYCYAKTVYGIGRAFYHKMIGREGSICCGDYEHLLKRDAVPNFKLIDNFLDEYGRAHNNKQYSSQLSNFPKFWMKWGLYQSRNYLGWAQLWPECHKVIAQMNDFNWKSKILLHIGCKYPKLLEIIYGTKR